MTSHDTAPAVHRPFRPRAIAALALALGIVIGAGAPALAHDPVATTNPADGSEITAAPAVFSVTTAQPMLDLSGDGAGFGLQVTDAAGLFYGDGCITVDGATLSMPATLGAPGTYTMVFQYISSDGHTTSGSVSFTYAPTDAGTASPGSPTPPTCGVPVETPSASPSATDSAEPTPSAAPTESGAAGAEGGGESSAVLAIVGGLGALLAVAAVVIALVVRRRASATE